MDDANTAQDHSAWWTSPGCERQSKELACKDLGGDTNKLWGFHTFQRRLKGRKLKHPWGWALFERCRHVELDSSKRWCHGTCHSLEDKALISPTLEWWHATPLGAFCRRLQAFEDLSRGLGSMLVLARWQVFSDLIGASQKLPPKPCCPSCLSLVFGPLIVLVFDTLLFAAGFGLVRFKIAGNGCGEEDLARAVTGAAGAFAGAFFFPSSAACDFGGLLTGEGVVVACGARGARFGVTGAASGLGSSTAFTPDGLGCSVAALLDGATKSTALSMTVSSNALGAFAVAPHNSLRKNSVTLESDRFAPWLSAVIFASRAEAARLRSEISELFGAALEPEAVSGWPDMLNYDHFEPYSYTELSSSKCRCFAQVWIYTLCTNESRAAISLQYLPRFFGLIISIPELRQIEPLRWMKAPQLQHAATPWQCKGFKAAREFQLYAAGKLICGCLGRKKTGVWPHGLKWLASERDMSVPRSESVSVDATTDLQRQIMTNTQINIYHIIWSKEVWSQMSVNMEDGKAEVGRVREEEGRRKKIREEKESEQGKINAREKVAASPGQMRNQKLQAAVARSTFWSQNAKNTSVSEHFWKLRRGRSARRCGPKRTPPWPEAHFQLKMLRHLGFGALLEVQVFKSALLWCEAHFEAKRV